MAEIRHLENRHDVIFYAESGLISIKFHRLVQNDMSTAVIWSKSKPDVEFQYGRRLREFHGCHPRATCHIAGCSHLAKSMSWPCHITVCNNSICHIRCNAVWKSFFAIFFWFLMQFGLWRIVSDTLVVIKEEIYMAQCQRLLGHLTKLKWREKQVVSSCMYLDVHGVCTVRQY